MLRPDVGDQCGSFARKAHTTGNYIAQKSNKTKNEEMKIECKGKKTRKHMKHMKNRIDDKTRKVKDDFSIRKQRVATEVTFSLVHDITLWLKVSHDVSA